MEIINMLSLVPGSSLDKIKAYINTLMDEADLSEPNKLSLKGIWKDKGFEKITDLDSELKEVRQMLGNSILARKC